MSRPLPPLAALRTFEAAARLLSFKLAALELHVTPGAVSQQIKLLEAQLGAPLFIRLTRALGLTTRGATLLPTVQQGLDLLDSAWRQCRSVAHPGPVPVPRPVLLAAPPSFATHWLVPRLASFHAQHPDIELQLISSSSTVAQGPAGPPNTGRASRARQRGGTVADLVITFSALVPPADGGSVDLLLAPVYLPVCAPALGRTLHTPGSVLRLVHDNTMRLAGPAGQEAWGWPQWLALQGPPSAGPTASLRVSNTVLAIEAALAGQGLALVAQALVARQLAAGTLVAPFGDTTLPGPYRYHLSHRPPRAGSSAPTVAAVHHWLMAQAALPPVPAARHAGRRRTPATQRGPGGGP